MGSCSLKSVIALTIFSLSLSTTANANLLSTRELLMQQRRAIKQDTANKAASQPRIITKYINAATGEPVSNIAGNNSQQGLARRYDTPLEGHLAGIAEKLVELIPKGTTIRCKLSNKVESTSETIIIAEILQDYKANQLQGMLIYGHVSKTENNKVYLKFTDLNTDQETITIKAYALSLNKSPGLKADFVDKKTEAVVIKEVGTLLYGLGKAAINNSSAGLGGRVFDKVTNISDTMDHIDTQPQLSINAETEFLLFLEAPIKFEKDWLI